MRRFFVALFLALVAIVKFFGVAAYGQPPLGSTGEFHDFYHGLKDEHGVSCCDISDCRPVDYRVGTVGYEAWADNRWIAIPDDKVLRRRENPTGSAILCGGAGIDDDAHRMRHGAFVIFCFLPGPET